MLIFSTPTTSVFAGQRICTHPVVAPHPRGSVPTDAASLPARFPRMRCAWPGAAPGRQPAQEEPVFNNMVML